MGPSLRLVTIAGIPLRVHWTFLLLLGWFFLSPLIKGGPDAIVSAMRSVVFVLGVFACVVLHEFGHALAARRFGIGTRDVTLLPIGGVARLERMPEKPAQELIVALAGPAVNVVIALMLIPLALFWSGSEVFLVKEPLGPERINLLAGLASVNVALVVFNLLPAFPMDGGRVLRALLAMAMPRAQATQIAARVGQGMSVLFAVLGFFMGNVLLMLIALFVFLGAAAESQATTAGEVLRGVRVEDAMVRRFRVLHESDTLADAAEELISGEQQDFPILRDGAETSDATALLGVLTRSNLIRALAAGGLTARVGQFMEPALPVVGPHELVQQVLNRAREELGGAPLLICVAATDGTGRLRLLGMVTGENVTELILIRSATTNQSRGDHNSQVASRAGAGAGEIS